MPAAVAAPGLLAVPIGLDDVASLMVGAGAAGFAVLAAGAVAVGAAGFGGAVAIGAAGLGGPPSATGGLIASGFGGTEDAGGGETAGAGALGAWGFSGAEGCGGPELGGGVTGGLLSVLLGFGGAVGCGELVAEGFAGGASEAFKVTRTVSFFNGMLLVCLAVGPA